MPDEIVPHSQATARDEQLTQHQLVERLRIHNPMVVDELYARALGQINAEEQRAARLDAKAQGLLGTSGLAVTLAFTFGGFLLQHRDLVLFALPAAIAYAATLALGLLAPWFAVRALKIREFRGIRIADVLNQEVLDTVDAVEAPSVPVVAADGTEAGVPHLPVDGAVHYKRFLCAHYWLIAQHNFRVDEDKAAMLRWGQNFFFAFLIGLLVIGETIAASAMLTVGANAS